MVGFPPQRVPLFGLDVRCELGWKGQKNGMQRLENPFAVLSMGAVEREMRKHKSMAERGGKRLEHRAPDKWRAVI